MRKIDGLSLIFINFYVPALIPRLNSTKTSLQLSENINLLTVCRLYTCVMCHEQRDLDKQQMFGVSLIYRLYNVGAKMEACGTPACISLGQLGGPNSL
jgi:hypothetical protein